MNWTTGFVAASWPWDDDLEQIEHLVDPHWKTFSQPPRAVSTSLAVICVILGILSYVGNATVIYIFIKHRRLRNPSGSLIINLAVSDFCIMAILCPMFVGSNMNGKWVFGEAGCQFYGFSAALYGTASIMTMTGIALDKYLVICKPTLTARPLQGGTPKRRAVFIIVFVWIYSFIWAVLPLLGLNEYVLEGFLTTCTFDYLDQSLKSQVFILAMCFGAFVAPLTVIAAAYSCIVWKVHVGAKRLANFNCVIGGAATDRITPNMQREVRTAKATFTIVVCWAFAWTPYAVVALMGVLGYEALLTPLTVMLPALFAKTAAVYNPFVYALRHKQYSSALTKEIMLRIGHVTTSARNTSSQEPFTSRQARNSRYS